MKKISQIETGGRFLYGGVEWVKLYAGDGTVAISAEPVFERAFDENNKNDWRSSSLRRELSGAFIDALVTEGADRAAFLDWESDLTADENISAINLPLVYQKRRKKSTNNAVFARRGGLVMGINVPAISLVTHDNRTGKKDTPYPVFFLPA